MLPSASCWDVSTDFRAEQCSLRSEISRLISTSTNLSRVFFSRKEESLIDL